MDNPWCLSTSHDTVKHGDLSKTIWNHQAVTRLWGKLYKWNNIWVSFAMQSCRVLKCLNWGSFSRWQRSWLFALCPGRLTRNLRTDEFYKKDIIRKTIIMKHLKDVLLCLLLIVIMLATSTFFDDTNQEICNWHYVQLTRNAWGWSKPSLDTRLLWYPVVSWGSYARKLSFGFGALAGFPKILGGVDPGFACSNLTRQ